MPLAHPTRSPQHRKALPGLLGVFAMTVLCGCSPPQADGRKAAENAPNAADPGSSRGVTSWSDRHEVFAEYAVPRVGIPSTWVAHVTDLASGQPRIQGPITLVLRQGNTEQQHHDPAPQRAGIYTPSLTFPSAGDWRVLARIAGEGGEDTVDLGTIRVEAKDASAPAPTHEAHAPVGAIAFTKESQWSMGIRLETVSRQRLVQRARLAGRVRAAPGRRAEIRSPLAGQLKSLSEPARPTLHPGQALKAGERVIRVVPFFSEATAAFAEAQAAVASSRAALSLAEATQARVARLVATQARSERDLQEAEAALATARARNSAAEALVRMTPTTTDPATSSFPLAIELHSPIDGLVAEVLAGPGDAVAADQALVVVLDARRVWIEAFAPESMPASVPWPEDTRLELPGRPGRALQLGRDLPGRRIAIGPEADPETRRVPILYEVENETGILRVGQSVVVAASIAEASDVLAVPESAILEEGDQALVLVQVEGERFLRQPVETGLRDDGQVEIRRGLAPGTRIVVRGAAAIRLASLSGGLPEHGHAH